MQSETVSFGTDPALRTRDEHRYAPLGRVLERSIEPDSLVFKIAQWVGSTIVEGALPPGSSISSVQIAEHFQTSRAPVRDALIVLEREGLVDIGIGRAARVTRVTLAEVREIYEVRSCLHALVSERIVAAASDAQIADLRTLHGVLGGYAAAGDIDAYFWTNVEFRDLEARIAGNSHARQVLDSLGLRTLLVRHKILSLPDRLVLSVKDHRNLLDAYEARNAMLAVAVTRTIIQQGLNSIEESGWAE